MVLNAGQWYFVKFCEEKASIQIDIIMERSYKSSAENRKQLVKFIDGKLQQICGDLMPAAAKPEACVPCPVCNEPHIKYKNLLNGRTDICRKKQVFIPEDWYRNLFTSAGSNFFTKTMNY